jgi:hypothetical protein
MALLPAVPVDDVVGLGSSGRLKVRSYGVSDRCENGLGDGIVRDPQKVGHVALAREMHRCPYGTEPATARRQHKTPHCGQHVSQAALCGGAIVAGVAGEYEGRRVTHMLAEIVSRIRYSRLLSAAGVVTHSLVPCIVRGGFDFA